MVLKEIEKDAGRSVAGMSLFPDITLDRITDWDSEGLDLEGSPIFKIQAQFARMPTSQAEGAGSIPVSRSILCFQRVRL